ncbi:MAG: PLP-dependent lyase/thiolase [bacterium]
MEDFWNFFSNDWPIQLTQGEGHTSLTKFNLNKQIIYLKNETENPNGSFKDRSLAYQLSYYLNQKINQFVISSSGNAAISAASYLSNQNADLHIFVANTIDLIKLHKLEKFSSNKIVIHQTAQPKSNAIKFAKANNCQNLRGSQDDQAIPGFKTIALELLQQLPEIDAIFIPCSSGTSTIAIHQAFTEHKKKIAIHIAQTTKINSIAKYFDKNFIPSSTNLANAISDRIALRQNAVTQAIISSKGFGWVISDQELFNAETVAAEFLGENYSYNSLLSLAAFIKSQTYFTYKFPVLLFSGL